jgi:hypothetical protein
MFSTALLLSGNIKTISDEKKIIRIRIIGI